MSCAMPIAAEPAPKKTKRCARTSTPERSIALMKQASETAAVPWMSSARSAEHDGAAPDR